MKEHVPSFEWIKLKEKLSPENIHFTYYLFFGKTKNSPIGYAQVAIKNEERVRKIGHGLFAKKQKDRVKQILWSAPSSSQEGVVFDPAFLKAGIAKTEKIFEEYNSREEVKLQELMVGAEVLGHTNLSLSAHQSHEDIVNCLVKNRANYQQYLEGLEEAQQKKIKSIWKKVYHDQSWRIGEYKKFKECFGYKKSGAKQYNQLKKQSRLIPYIQQADLFLTFESPEEVFGIVFMFHGSPGQMFFKTCAVSENVEDELLTQAAIMRFYEEPECSKLRFLERTKFTSELASLGFTQKCVHLLELKA